MLANRKAASKPSYCDVACLKCTVCYNLLPRRDVDVLCLSDVVIVTLGLLLQLGLCWDERESQISFDTRVAKDFLLSIKIN